MNSLDDLRDRAPSLAVVGTTLAGLALVAPLEHAAGMALGLSTDHAWTVTLTVEGAAGTAIVAGHYVRAALALTGSSVLLGALWSADRAVRAEHLADPAAHPASTLADDPARAGLAVGVVALVVAALALVHYTRSQVAAARLAAADRAREQARADADRAHARQLELDRLADERAARERADVAAEAERQRRHVAELSRARAFDEQERARLSLSAEQERARVAREQAAAEQARADAAREQAAAERARADRERTQAAAEQRRAAAEQEQAAAEQARAAREQERAEYLARLRTDRGFARDEWSNSQWDALTLAELLDVSESRARGLIAEWRRPHAVRGSDA